MSYSNVEFNATMFVSEQLSRQLVNAAQDLAHRCVYECASRYNFDAEEAIRFLGLAMVKLERKSQVSKGKVVKSAKVSAPKAAFPLPYNGEFNSSFCYALRQNNGLYTQCTGVRKGEANFCKGCASQMQKTGAEVPEYGTIQQRMEVGVFEYVDPKGRRPVAYTKVMKKYKISKEQVLEEAGKLNININEEHFVEAEEGKRGRPKVEKEVKVKGVKGRPKKEKKVLEIEGDDEDLFASLVAQANMEEDVVMKKKSSKSDEDKEAERLAKEAEKEAKRVAAEAAKAAKAEKEAKLAAEKAEKEAKKEQERLAREAKKAEEEAAKKAKEEQRLKEKAEKEAKLAAEKEAKEQAKSQKGGKKVVSKKDEEEEADVVKKIEFEGKKYLKSKKTGIIYDYTEYVSNGEQVVVGKWNEKTNKIDFEDAGEESEEEYD
jgi:hypothetical protein